MTSMNEQDHEAIRQYTNDMRRDMIHHCWEAEYRVLLISPGKAGIFGRDRKLLAEYDISPEELASERVFLDCLEEQVINGGHEGIDERCEAMLCGWWRKRHAYLDGYDAGYEAGLAEAQKELGLNY